MNLLEQTPSNGVRVTPNATALAVALTAGASAMTCDDTTIFAQNDYISIEGESLKITDVDDASNVRDITRAQVDHNSVATVATAHEVDAYVLDRDGYALLDYTFDGATNCAGWFVWSERAFWCAIEKAGDIDGCRIFVDSQRPFIVMPNPVYMPAAAEWKILIWCTHTRVFHGGIFN